MDKVSDVVLKAYNQYLFERNGHQTWMDEDQIGFRNKWKKQHGRMKGANKAYRRKQIRIIQKINKELGRPKNDGTFFNTKDINNLINAEVI